MADNLAHPYYNRGRVLTIEDLPDEVLIEIFDFYVGRYHYPSFRHFSAYRTKRTIESWKSLVHVCRRWRGLVFGSPRRLNLQLVHIPGKCARKSLDLWPAFPLHIFGSVAEGLVDNVIPGLEHRICQINLVCGGWDTSSQTKKLWAAMQVSFPELEGLYLYFGTSYGLVGLPWYDYGPVLPDSFLGGSAPRLRYVYLDGIPFPGLPKILLSATRLVNLYLHHIPSSGYISPGAMATCLSMLTSLETLQLEFEPHQHYRDLNSQRPPTRYVLPTLAIFRFRGVKIYLKEFVARIDAPQLYRLSTTFTIDSISSSEAIELKEFISRTPSLRSRYDEAHLIFDSDIARVRLCPHPQSSKHRMVEVESLCPNPYQRLSSLVQTCTSSESLRLLLTMENLYIDGELNLAFNDIENTKWLDLLLPFTAVKNIYLSELSSPRIALVLKQLAGGRTTEIFPALQNVFLEGSPPSKSVQRCIRPFISARRHANHPITISVWRRDPVPVWNMSWEAND